LRIPIIGSRQPYFPKLEVSIAFPLHITILPQILPPILAFCLFHLFGTILHHTFLTPYNSYMHKFLPFHMLDTPTLFWFPFFAKCLLELSLRKWFFSKFFFDRDYPTLHGTSVMDYLFDEEEQESRTTLPQGGGDDVAPVTDVATPRPSSATPPIVDATPWPKSPPSGPSTLTHATRDKVNSFLSILDLVDTLNGMLPHVDMLYVIRYKSHRGPERRNTHGARKRGKGRGAIHHGARKREEEEKKKKKEERGEEGWPAQNPVGPAPRPDCPVAARSTGPRTGPPGPRPGLTGPKPDPTGMTPQAA
jgi:hypothetical protein